ncbi:MULTISPECIES: GerMN domain-containing protein [Shouchella]|uniref:GerMN domain-containing protein n=2 Tax=Shouchella TaxID=2893057 RepID=A0ABY7W8H4_9BACI|nr:MULTISPECIES: GerMN domain-containing protein [Shouchella]MED4129244.1 GerMN domain-containing protein [Shouchella miscanthi]WDF04137.1 GerMN domain-containing protein [Shouchella hunanensis]
MRKLVGISAPLIVTLTLAVGCSTGADEPVSLDDPEITYTNETEETDPSLSEADEEDSEEESDAEENKDTDENNEADAEQTPDQDPEAQNLRQLYLFDSNGMVVPQTIELPKTDSTMKQSLEYLVADGPLQDVLPNGFRAVLPAGTTVDVNHLKEDKIAVANFSNEFEEYNVADEKGMFEAVTWTLTQFEDVDEVKIEVNGVELEQLPMSETPIVGNFSREDGINLDYSNVVDFTNSQDVTVYFLGSHENETYYVPVTRRVADADNEIVTVVNELIDGPSLQMRTLLTEMNDDMMLLNDPEIKDGELVLDFNEAIQTMVGDQAYIEQSIIESIALSLTERNDVEKISILVNGKENVFSESGEAVETIQRPAHINKNPL